ncbi:hypothetical protein PVL29_021957 [Vitis rotundifolia]|uniref:Uncharacterized protein n=1 Tax=Vitis rotundifolia TaxID=103349 RepID=A0AA39DA84_VITRO|nr:hypothetical protein PVL29_021957 [Vitis rotundifolia]
MEVLQTTTERSSSRTSLLDSSPQQPRHDEGDVDGDGDRTIDEALRQLETFLRVFGFCQYSLLSFALSSLSFLVVGVVTRLLCIELSNCSNCEKYQIKRFELEILVSDVVVAAISLFCISHNLRKYGVRRFLFVDRCHGHLIQFREEYVQRVRGFFRLLVIWILPCFLVKTLREIIRIIYVHQNSWWESVAILFALIVSWSYSTIIYFSACALFNLVCNLQVIHFENYGKLLERDLDVLVYIEEHIVLTHHLSKISHRFRMFLVLEFLVVTASQFVALFQTTGNRGIINFVNGSDFVVSSIVQVVGIILCLHGATKISHRARGISSVGSRWHALVTCNSNEASQLGTLNSRGNMEASQALGSLPITNSESDLESIDVPLPVNTQLASYMSTYQKRQAFVSYLQSNPGGFTVFGWIVDRALITTILFIELSLIMFVLGKTITYTTT